MLRRLVLSLVAICVSACSGCSSEPLGGEQPRSEIFVLVDLSETWHNARDEARNSRVLGEIGAGIALVADTAEPPLLVDYRVIGADSLEREPLCQATFVPTLISTRSQDPTRITNKRKLEAYLATDCPRLILSRPSEQQTQISAALASVAAQPRAPHAKRWVIVTSDFLEESVARAPLGPESLSGSRVLLAFRPITDDQGDPVRLTQRIDEWRQVLEGAGAQVDIAPDTGLRRSAVTGFLSK